MTAVVLHRDGADQTFGPEKTIELAPLTQLRMDATGYYGHYDEWQLRRWRFQVLDGSHRGSCVELSVTNDNDAPLPESPPGLRPLG